MTVLILTGIFILSFILSTFAFFAGQFFGYRRGVREVVQLNDLSYRTRLAYETDELRKRGEDVTNNQKQQLANMLEYERGVKTKPVVERDAVGVLLMPIKPDAPVA